MLGINFTNYVTMKSGKDQLTPAAERTGLLKQRKYRSCNSNVKFAAETNITALALVAKNISTPAIRKARRQLVVILE